MPTDPDSLEVVQVMKQESSSLGGDDADAAEWGQNPINPLEDAVEAAGLFLVDSGDSRPIKTRAIWPDGNNLRFKDISNPGSSGEGYTLSELLAGSGGLTESQHRALRQLIHFIDDGPAEGFASGAYCETTGTVFPTAVTWYTDSGKTSKIVERLLTWTGPNVTTDQWKMYDTDGSTVLVTVTDTISYSGLFETSRTRAIA